MNKTTPSPILGIIERVAFPELAIADVVAKIDTGAYSGALHCSYIERVTDNDGHKSLRFTPYGSDMIIEVTHYIKTYIRSATGHRVRRYLIDTPIVIHGKQYSIRIGLSDRSTMKTSVLIGRRFLRKEAMLVDVRINQTEDNDGGGKL
jgi:hypothetical protein